MPGNTRKNVWNKPGTIGNNIPSKPGSALANFRDAVTIEEAVMGIGLNNAHARRDKAEARAVKRTAEERAKITLSTPEWLANFMMRED